MVNRTETDHHEPPPSVLTPVLKQVLPLDRGFDLQRWPIDQDCIFGREPGTPQGIALAQDSRVSRQHVQLCPRADYVELVDLKSKNHTFVDGRQVESTTLVDGSVLRIGNTLFVLRYEPMRRNDAPRTETSLHARLLGQSREVRALRATLSQVARSIDPVLLLGPTGCGKEEGARAIHALSTRRDRPFVAVNCAAVPEHLAESMLFGHVKGAFTGADRDHEGFFHQAHGGTLFLDELGELPAVLQSKLLRALQPIESSASRAGEEYVLNIHRTGAREPTRVDVRLIAATNSDIEDAVGRSTFREDLRQRLAVLQVHFPSLAQRRDDILPMFLHVLNQGSGGERAIQARLGELLLLHHWPGNVRELINLSKRLRLVGDGRTALDREDLPEDLLRQLTSPTRVSSPAPPSVQAIGVHSPGKSVPRPQLTRQILQDLLIKHQGNRTQVAHELMRDRKTIRRRMDELGIPRTWGYVDGTSSGEQDDEDDDKPDS